MVPRDRVSLGILAGGRGSRLGGADKAFLQWQSRDLLEHALQCIGSGFAEVLVSHNRQDDPRRRAYEQQGLRFVADGVAAGQGPLAGLDALLHAAAGDWLLTLPVDLADPSGVPVDTLLEAGGAVLRDADGLQPLVALWPVPRTRVAVRAALAAGERSVQALAAMLQLRMIDIAPRMLGNLNTPGDFAATA